MDTSLFPTKGNLILAKNTLRLSRQGYELLDKKRNILIREMMVLIGKAEEIQSRIDTTFSQAYGALQIANITLGVSNVGQVGYAVPEEDNIEIKFRSVMGVEIPIVTLNEAQGGQALSYGFFATSSALDEAYVKFSEVKKLAVLMAEVETSVYRLAENVKKTQKRANALKNIMIPRYESLVLFITNALEEKDREEFTRLKVIKRKKIG